LGALRFFYLKSGDNMLKYFIQVIENLLAAAILAALLFSALVKNDVSGGASDNQKSKKIFLWGCAAGAGAALVLSVLRRTTALINRSIVNAWTLSFAVIAGIIYICILVSGKKKGGTAITAILAGLLLFYALPTIFLYPTEFLLAGETIFSTDFLFKFIGYAAGLGVVFLSALGIFKAAVGAADSLFRIVLIAGLSVNILNQLTVIVQFLFARRIIRIIRSLFLVVAAAVNHSTVFLFVIMALSFLLPLAVFIKTFAKKEQYANPAEGRKIRAGKIRRRRWAVCAAAGLAVSVFALTTLTALTQRGVVLSPAEPMSIQGDEIIIPIEQVQDGHLHRFVYAAQENIEVRFIVIQKNEIAFGVGLDACDICGPTGYYERKNEVICRLCDVVMNKSTIGFKGGCNPVPLAYSLRSGSMVILTADLENERGRFK
jgi:uncharacterized membrane protein